MADHGDRVGRGRVPIAVTVPAVDPRRAHQIVASAGCRSAEVTVGDGAGSLADDVARLEAVREALGADGVIRCRTAEQLAAVRAGVDVPIATSVPIHPNDAPRASLVGVADVAVLRCGPLG